MEETIPEYLARVAKNDAEKGFDGLRSSREIADYFGISIGSARRLLYRLEMSGEVAAFDDGTSTLWGLPAKDPE